MSRNLRVRLSRLAGITVLAGALVGVAGPPAQAVPARASTAAVNHRYAGKDLVTHLESALGGAAAGSYLDAATGAPTVDVLTAAAAGQVRAAGAVPKLVRHSRAELEAAKSTLDRLPAKPQNTSWGVDPVGDNVVVTLSDAAGGPALNALLAAVRSLGDQATIKHTHGTFKPAKFDGDAITGGGWRCSLGFNVQKNDQNYIITAAHCLDGVDNWDGIGPTVGPSSQGYDYGLIENDSGDAPSAATRYDGTIQPITSIGYPTVGEPVCKSGSTSQFTCGTVLDVGQTLNANGTTQYDSIHTSVMIAQGDSGGPLFDGTTGYGVASTLCCDSESWFTPVLPAMDEFGVSLTAPPDGPEMAAAVVPR